MGIQFNFLPVKGESILITTDNPQYTILIDGGKPSSSKILKAELLKLNRPIDLIILTHIDRDHIGGLIKIFKSIEDFDIYKVWFNCSANIAIFEKEYEYSDNTSFRDGYKLLSELINCEKTLHINRINTETFANIEQLTHDLSIQIISPNKNGMDELFDKWDKWHWKNSCSNTSGQPNDYCFSLDELATHSLSPDSSLPNLSSIAFILAYKKMKFLFLGDAHIDVVVSSLRNLDIAKDNIINFEFIKLSHHGSSYNINEDFLKIVSTNHYIICNKGWDNLPHKKTIAYILKYNPDKKLIFTSTDSLDKLFKQDIQKPSQIILDDTGVISYE